MSVITQVKILPPSGEPAIADIGASAGNITYTNTTSELTATDVQNAIDELSNDYSNLGTAAEKDVPASGDASVTEVVMGDDTRLTNARNAADVSAWAKASTKPTYTASEVGAIPSTDKGSNGGVAELDSSGKVPSSQLPSFVDDVIEGYYNTTDGKFYKEFTYITEITGESGKIYLDLSTDTTWRWSGSAFTQIKGDLTLGETSTTAYRGDRGKAAYDHSQATHARTDATKVESSTTNGNIKINGTETTVYTHPGSGTNPHGTTASDVGLGNVGNFKAVSTVASQGLSSIEQTNARANIGAGTSNLVLGNSSTNAYYGDKGKTAYDHSQLTTGNPHNVTASDVGLGNVGNFKAVSTAVNQGLTDTEQANARSNIGAGTSSFSGSYNDLTNKPTIPTVNNATLTIQKNGTNVQTFTANASSNVTANITMTKSDVGLGNVGNFKAVSTVANQGLTEAEKQAARANIGAGSESQTVTVDSSLSATSTNPVQNKILADRTWTLHGITWIPENADLNDYVNDGNYFCGSSSTGGTVLHKPTEGNIAFALKVYETLSNGRHAIPSSSAIWVYKIQEFIAYTGERFYRKIQISDIPGQWEYDTWQKIYDSGANKVPYSEITGKPTVDSTPTSGSNNLITSGGVYASEQDIYEVMGQMGAKNLFYIKIDFAKFINNSGTWSGNSYTLNGVTFNCDVDNNGYITKITSNGTSESATFFNFYIYNNKFPISKGNYILSGCPSGGNFNNGYALYAYTDGYKVDTGDGVSFSIASDTTVQISIIINANCTVSNKVFYPMIRLASDTDSTYQPYTKTNQELTKETIGLLDNVNKLGAKNLLPLGTLSYVKSSNSGGTWNGNQYELYGVTYTLNTDDNDNIISISATGTATNRSNLYLRLNKRLDIEEGQYILSCYGRIDTPWVEITLIDKTTEEITYLNTRINQETIVNVENAYIYSIYISVGANVNVNGKTYYPMLRLASEIDKTYAPYAKTNRELTEDINAIDLTTKYDTEDSASTTINDTDYIPMSENGGTKKKTLWSTVIDKIKTALGIVSGGTGYLKKDGTWGTPTNTTYSFATGDSNGQIKVTPSGGNAQNVDVKGLGSAAYTASTAYAAASHTHNYAGSASAGGPASYLTYQHGDEINFKGGAKTTCYFNYRNAETDSAAAVNAITYKFCNYSNDSSKSTVDAANFTGTAAVASKLGTSTVGSASRPIYLNGGTPTQISYTIEKSVPSNAVFTDTNTWRGIQNNLTSTSTSDSLSANQGRLLANGSARDSTKLPLSGGTMTGTIYMGNSTGSAIYASGAASSATTHLTGSGFLNLRSPGIQCRSYTDGGWAGISASTFTTQSSRRYKENIQDISEEEANKLLDIRVVKFDYKKDITDEEHRYNQHGVIAEETIEVIPEVVTCAIPYGQESQFDEPVPDSVDYAKFTPYLIKMIQMQQKEINELKSLVKELTQ